MHSIDKTLRHLRSLHSRTRFYRLTIILVRSLILALVTIGLWLLINPTQDSAALFLGFGVFLITLLASRSSSPTLPIQQENILFNLEIDNQDIDSSAFTLRKSKSIPTNWQIAIDKFVSNFKKNQRQRLKSFAGTLALPALVLILIVSIQPRVFDSSVFKFAALVDYFKRGATLKVEEGMVHAKDLKEIKLSRNDTAEIELLDDNLVKLELRGFRRADGQQISPTIELREDTTENTVFQTFQTNLSSSTESKYQNFLLKFSVSQNLLLYIPSISSKPLAKFKVKKRPLPEVTLSSLTKLKDPWPDDKPLKLSIKVTAKNALQLVRLVIFSGKKRSQELIARIIADDKHEFATEYNLLLEPYIDSDLSEVEILAEAIDRAIPAPLVGQSKAIRLSTVSAYGRYRKVLGHLRKLKNYADQAIEENKSSLSEKAQKSSQLAATESADTPFFDGLDRGRIFELNTLTEQSVEDADRARIMTLSERLNAFLFEHETLDDRERDRDFFVAARGLSRVISQKQKDRPVDVKTVAERMTSYLKKRQRRWELRLERIEKNAQPPKADQVLQNTPFQNSMNKIAANESNKQRNTALAELTQAISNYREWIESLEKAEDAQRKSDKKKRQEGLSTARNELKELQKNQGKISKELDKSGQRNNEELSTVWPKARSQQNSNLEETGKLEAKFRALSPRAGERLKAATRQMNSVLSAGNDRKFSQAESHSDLASRLLRQADSAAQQSQKQEQRSRGRRRRVSGDNYYGQPILGGDVEIRHDYQVDRRYREDILDEMRSTDPNSESQLLDNYLRRVIR